VAAAKAYSQTAQEARTLIEDASRGIFKSVYLLFGEEPFYTDRVCEAVTGHCLQEWEKDFNETICFGADVDAETVVTAARRFPMMAERQLVVVKEAQMMKDLESLSLYCDNPLDSTVLVIYARGTAIDKRKALYKSVQKLKGAGAVLESTPVRDYQIPDWIISYYASRGLSIDPEAARFLGEAAGTDLSRIAVETDKLLKNLPEGTRTVTAEDIERNVGISRQFSVYELTKALSYKKKADAVRIATHIGNEPRFVLLVPIAALSTHFGRILRLHALLMQNPSASADEKASLLGVNRFFLGEYDSAVRNYPLKSVMAAISLLTEYDYKGKGGDGGEAPQGDLFVELVTKLLNF